MNLIIKIIQQNNMKKILSTIGIIGVIAVAVYTTYLATGGTGGELLGGQLSDTSGTFVYYAGDLIGTKTGTSTSPVGFYGDNTVASSTYTTKIGNRYKDLTFYNQAVNASSSAMVYFSVLGSNDMDCDTATTSTSLANTIVTGDINWFDIGQNVKNLAGSQTLAGTSTIAWDTSGADGTGNTFTLTDVNTECVRLEVSASSTELWTQLKLR